MRTEPILKAIAVTLLMSGVALYAEPRGPQCPGTGMPPGANASGPGVQYGHPGGLPIPDAELLKQAGASEQQIQTLREFGFEQRAKRIDLQAAEQKAQLNLERLMSAATVDEKAAMAAVYTVTQTRGELFKQDIAAALKVKQVLGEDLMRKLRPQGPPETGDGRGPGSQGQNPPPHDEGDRPARD